MTLHHPSGYLRRLAHKQPHDAAWQRYESAKNAWCVRHPGATPAEYQQAMTRIRAECGVAG
mgnify:CR=1 FL=1